MKRNTKLCLDELLLLIICQAPQSVMLEAWKLWSLAIITFKLCIQLVTESCFTCCTGRHSGIAVCLFFCRLLPTGEFHLFTVWNQRNLMWEIYTLMGKVLRLGQNTACNWLLLCSFLPQERSSSEWQWIKRSRVGRTVAWCDTLRNLCTKTKTHKVTCKARCSTHVLWLPVKTRF